MRKHLLGIGDPAPWFSCRLDGNDIYRFDTAAGRYIMICFLGSMQEPENKQVISFVKSYHYRFDGINLSFFGVSTNDSGRYENRIDNFLPGIHYLRDFDFAVSKLYGAVKPDGSYRKVVYIIDPSLRVMTVIPLSSSADLIQTSLISAIENIPVMGPGRIAEQQAPVLILPRVFEPELCNMLIDYFNKSGGKDSGYMRDINGKTVGVIDHTFKRRRDCRIRDDSLRQECMRRIYKRLIPQIKKVFQFPASQMERYIIACYDAGEGGFFSAHRDNTTRATAHRRFAVSLFLNSDYEGGHLRFPEFGPDLFSAPTGGAVIFSCSLLHEATKVTKGRRYMFLPFIHDDAGQEIRKNNSQFLESTIINKNLAAAANSKPDSVNSSSEEELH